MWFGDLVTMAWWDDLWLNESFASWMGDKVTDQVFPQYNMSVRELAGTQRAMVTDARLSTRAIRQSVDAFANIDRLFDELSYQKGQAVLGMLESWLTPEVFRKGVTAYLKEHEWQNATAADLWKALSAASGRDVTPATDSLPRPGRRAAGERARSGPDGTVRLTQRRFLNYGVSRPAPGRLEDPGDAPLLGRQAELHAEPAALRGRADGEAREDHGPGLGPPQRGRARLLPLAAERARASTRWTLPRPGAGRARAGGIPEQRRGAAGREPARTATNTCALLEGFTRRSSPRGGDGARSPGSRRSPDVFVIPDLRAPFAIAVRRMLRPRSSASACRRRAARPMRSRCMRPGSAHGARRLRHGAARCWTGRGRPRAATSPIPTRSDAVGGRHRAQPGGARRGRWRCSTPTASASRPRRSPPSARGSSPRSASSAAARRWSDALDYALTGRSRPRRSSLSRAT